MDHFAREVPFEGPSEGRIPLPTLETYLGQRLATGVSSHVIYGPAGIGKTSLALGWAHSNRHLYPGGIRLFRNSTPGPELITATTPAPGPSLSILDDLDTSDAGRVANMLHFHSDNPGNTQLIITTRDWPDELRWASASFALKGLPDPDARVLAYQLLGDGASSDLIQQVVQIGQGNPAAITLAAVLVPSDKSYDHARVSLSRGGILGPDGTALAATATRPVLQQVQEVDRELLLRLSQNPELLHALTPRMFELVVVELLARMGYTVTLTAVGPDGGVDIFAAAHGELGSFLYVVECKKWSPKRPVGVGVIRSLYGVVESGRTTAGLVVTTSSFTAPARELQQQVKFRLALRDFGNVVEWLKASAST